MKILDLSMFDNLSSKDLTAEQLKMSLGESGTYLRDLVVSSTNEGNSFGQVERAVFQALKKIGLGAIGPSVGARHEWHCTPGVSAQVL
jgi:hypothetical protein